MDGCMDQVWRERGWHTMETLAVFERDGVGSISSFIPPYCCFPCEEQWVIWSRDWEQTWRVEFSPFGVLLLGICMKGASTLVSGQSGEDLCLVGGGGDGTEWTWGRLSEVSSADLLLTQVGLQLRTWKTSRRKPHAPAQLCQQFFN